MVAHEPAECQWASLPSDLKELVLAHLSKPELLRLHFVSREWRSILSSSHFRRLHHHLHPRSNPSLLIYNLAVKISVCDLNCADGSGSPSITGELPLSHAPPAPSAFDHRRYISVPTVFIREWVGAGSLICIRNHLTADALSVGCPFSNQWRALPNPLPAPLISKLWAMVPHTSMKAKSAFSVLLLQLNSPSMYLDVYDSESNQWIRRALPAANGSGKCTSISFSSTAACISGLVYAVQPDSRVVATYDVQRDLWKTLEAKLPANLVFQVSMPGNLVQTVPHMIKGWGKVLMVGAASDGQNDISGDKSADVGVGSSSAGNGRGIINYAVVWELDWARKEWKEISRAPSDMCRNMVEEARKSHKAAVTRVKYGGHAELVLAMATGSRRALRFDVIEGKWAWLELPSAVNCDLALCLQPKAIQDL